VVGVGFPNIGKMKFHARGIAFSGQVRTFHALFEDAFRMNGLCLRPIRDLPLFKLLFFAKKKI
jgi:hypothetical protein